MITKGRRRSKNVEDRRSWPVGAKPLWTDWPQDATFRGSVDAEMAGNGGILPYMLGVPPANSLYETPNYRIQKRVPPPIPRPNPRRKKSTIAQGG